MSKAKAQAQAARAKTNDAIARDQRAFLRVESRPVNSDERPMICCGCSAYIVATVADAKAQGWDLWIGGALCNQCLVDIARRSGAEVLGEPPPMTPAEIKKFRAQIPPEEIGRMLDNAEKMTRNLGCAFGMVGRVVEAREVGRMAERLWCYVKEGRR